MADVSFTARWIYFPSRKERVERALPFKATEVLTMPPFVHRADGQSASRNDVALLNLKIDALTSALEKLATKEAKMSKAVPFDESSVQSETDNENWDRLKPLDSRTRVPDWLSYASNPRGRQASHVEGAPTHDRSEAGHSTASGSVYTPETSKTWSESVKTDKPNPAKNSDIITLDIATITKIISDMRGLSRGSFEQARGQYPASDKLTIKWERMGWKTVFEMDVLSSEEPVADMSKEHAKREIVARCEAHANPDETWNWDGDLEVDRTRFERMLESFVDSNIPLIGEVFHNRYKVIGKLGYGSASTVWLGHDTSKEKEYVALKIYINSSKVHRELPIYKHIKSVQSQHGGLHFLRALLDSFEIIGHHGKHTCLVHEALGMNLGELREILPDEMFPPDLVRQTLRDILRTLHFLHEEAHVVHTGKLEILFDLYLSDVEIADIQPRNILLGILDNSAFERFEREAREQPMPRKELSDHTVCISQPMPSTKGATKLSDFSEARFHSDQNTDRVMPDVFRAPEVVLGMPWSYSVDLWGFSMTLWDLFEPSRLFSATGEDGRYSEQHHMVQMVAMMGPPSLDFLQRSKRSSLFWDDRGKWKGTVPTPDTSLEAAEQRLQGEEKALFLAFMRKTLRWRPEDRSEILDVFMDEWLLADLIESGQVLRE
ncbi:hypothetical protein B9Z65_8956 [Elsinoe australis]|uniref:Protein kinase domain-containing protein n=1 Tax=Elsinoe australis TaxID=40998 RepID=A0A2P7ZYX1_9PEZI|nr:hypothetical protein B9Z65_8956 [Elsinoe australis]